MHLDENVVDKSISDIYWKTRKDRLEIPNGKRSAVTTSAKLINELTSTKPASKIRVLELGCGEGHLLGLLAKLCESITNLEFVGMDIRSDVLDKACVLYPSCSFLHGDYTQITSSAVGKFDLVLAVNTLHEVYSSAFSTQINEIDTFLGKKRTKDALKVISTVMNQDGHIVIFDGVEPDYDSEDSVVLKFDSEEWLEEFKSFASEYRAYKVRYRNLGNNRAELSVRDFVRYITKTIFLGKPLWVIEKNESYQYYREAEFLETLLELEYELVDLQYFSPSYELWRQRVSIETPGIEFPNEHIMLTARKR